MKWSFAVAFAVVAASGAASFAQDAWPTKSVSVLVPFAAGGNTDVLARIFAERLSARLGQQFVIENRAGAGGTTGVVAMTKAAADGYTLGVATTAGLASNAVIMKDKLGYNTERDIAYLYNMATQPNLLVAHPSVPAKTLPELAAWLKANPKTPYATSGIGSSQHVCGEMLAQQAGVEMSAVAYRASNLQMQDLIAGHIKLACDNFATAWEQVKAGNARAIAVGSPKRYSFSPDVPTFAETFPGFEVLSAFGWIGQANLDKAIVAKIIAELSAVGEEPEVKKRLALLGVESSGLSGADFAAYMRSERERLVPIVEKAGIQVP
ncbi:MAG TPA: tripartite tricarboxylate transporter substrate binding protein [Xanthobacteraceae bacterium]|nr:tripartite tricarboxylate transporter substrate binding protein [Xanthobacteraceae bacterium]